MLYNCHAISENVRPIDVNQNSSYRRKGEVFKRKAIRTPLSPLTPGMEYLNKLLNKFFKIPHYALLQ
jgi:hypothetical protein